MKRTPAPRFADPDHPSRIGYTKLTEPVGFSPRAATPNTHAPKALRPGRAKPPAVDKIGAMPSRNAPAQDILRGIGSRRIKMK